MSEQLYRKKPVEWVEKDGVCSSCLGRFRKDLTGYHGLYVCQSSPFKDGDKPIIVQTMDEAKQVLEAQRDEMLNQYFEKVRT